VKVSKREAILDAAAAAIADHGVRGLRVEDVAERAGVVVSLLYYYFGSRTGLLRATMHHSNERAPTLSPADLEESDRTAFELLEQAMLAELGSSDAVRQNCVVWNELNASAVFDPELRKEFAAVAKKWSREVAAFIRLGQHDGSIRDGADAQEEADLLTSLVEGLIMRWLAGSLTRERARRLLRTSLRDRLPA
jgi:AcrR family transcriptional regulator